MPDQRRVTPVPRSTEITPTHLVRFQDLEGYEASDGGRPAHQRIFRQSSFFDQFDKFGHTESLFVGAAEDRNLARLLLENRSYGYPGTDGTLFSNYIAYVMNRHPILSIFMCHPLHPFTRTERMVVLWCSIFWAFFTNTIMQFRLFQSAHNWTENSTLAYLIYITILALLIIPYEILIRVIIICPCCLGGELRALGTGNTEEASQRRQERDSLKVAGRRILCVLVLLSVVWFSFGLIASLGLHKSGLDGKRQDGDEAYTLDEAAALLLLVKIWQLGPVWLLQWTPVFCLWYNRDKNAWIAAHPEGELYCTPSKNAPVWRWQGAGTRGSKGCCGLCHRISVCLEWFEKKVLCACSCCAVCWPCGNAGPCAPIQRATGCGCLRCGDDDGTGGLFDRNHRNVSIEEHLLEPPTAPSPVAVAVEGGPNEEIPPGTPPIPSERIA
jgi:hypothetical protein